MQTVGFEPTRANTLRPERSTLDHSVIFAYVYFSHLAYFNGTSDSSSFVLQSLLSYCTHKIGNSTPIISTVEFNRDDLELWFTECINQWNCSCTFTLCKGHISKKSNKNDTIAKAASKHPQTEAYTSPTRKMVIHTRFIKKHKVERVPFTTVCRVNGDNSMVAYRIGFCRETIWKHGKTEGLQR